MRNISTELCSDANMKQSMIILHENTIYIDTGHHVASCISLAVGNAGPGSIRQFIILRVKRSGGRRDNSNSNVVVPGHDAPVTLIIGNQFTGICVNYCTLSDKLCIHYCLQLGISVKLKTFRFHSCPIRSDKSQSLTLTVF